MMGKCIGRVDDMDRLGIHSHYMKRNGKERTGVWKKYFEKEGGGGFPMQLFRISEENMEEWPIHINHYQSQSLEQWVRKRSNCSMDICTFGRNLNDAVRFDNDIVYDDTLMRKGHWKSMPFDCLAKGGPPAWKDLPPVDLTAALRARDSEYRKFGKVFSKPQ